MSLLIYDKDIGCPIHAWRTMYCKYCRDQIGLHHSRAVNMKRLEEILRRENGPDLFDRKPS